MLSGISLANKCQLLFGAAIVAILIAALAIPWMRAQNLVGESQLEMSRQLADAWLADDVRLRALYEQAASAPQNVAPFAPESGTPMRMRLVRAAETSGDDDEDNFEASAFERFRADPDLGEHASATQIDGVPVYRYARAVRQSHLRKAGQLPATTPDTPSKPGDADSLAAVLVIERTSQFAEGQVLTSRLFIIAAGIIGAILAGLVFHFILTKLILSPVRSLRGTAERVRGGDLRIRANIRTGDEFEQLSAAFNTMLDRLEQGQAQLKSLNETLDFKVSELAEANVGLFESNKLKSEFLANVSHELRTPLNSIIGFAELLEEIAKSEQDVNPKRMRYITNILSSGRSLLEMINDLLNMAKIESGRMEVNIEPTNVGDLIEGLANVMRPQAENKQITLRTVIGQRLPAVETDPGKLQQILYNFLSNAIKFTPEGGNISVSADRVTQKDAPAGVRVAVVDTGQGIPHDMQDVIFEKFRQVDASHTRQHQGTGLGLAICRELAELLGATVSFVSEPGRGATFFVDVPLTHQAPAPQPLMAGA